MKNCCIEGCGESSEQGISFFEFPASRMLRKRWVDAINPTTKIDNDAVICMRHFSTGDYEDIRGKIRLKSKVVPSVFGDGAQSHKSPKTTENENVKDRTENHINDNHNGKDGADNENNDKENNDEGNSASENSSKAADNNTHNDKSNADIKADNDTEKLKNHVEKVNNDTENVTNDIEKVNNDSENVNKDHENVYNDNEKVNDDVEKPDNSSEKVSKKLPNKKVKKKIVPYRKVGTRSLNKVLRRNGHIDREDSSSQDSVSSSLPPEAPVKEDIEDIIANYHIENKKTERQIAAMIPEEPPPQPEPLVADDVDFGMECAPVFIELSVGQDSMKPEEQPNDCLMVLESVQCEVDPTLLLEARAEDEECLEQIDLSDDDKSDVTPACHKPDDKRASKRPKPSADPISLLTSSDEDDVIIQEPKIDTLSVSDETDEDDVPLTRLIKTEKKQKKPSKSKKSKKKKPLSLKSILVHQEDFFCMHCNKICESSNELKSHKKIHAMDYQENPLPITKVYQICKECGFTTSSKSQLARHQRKHTSEKRFKCPLCSYKSKYNMSLMYHLKTHDFDPNMYNCGACGLELGDKKALLEHQKGCYALEEKFKCGKCSHVAENRKQLKLHRYTVHKHK